ncbi:MAG: hypothetical protein ABIL58_23355 [Pseudomonadota bacterium]
MIPIKDVKDFREALGLTHLVVFGVDPDGVQHVATHGGTVEQAKQAADAGNHLKAALRWPSDLCKSTPLERVCGNCGRPGKALFEFCKSKGTSDPACIHFEPKG